jgi:hypothetical protein
MTIAGMIAVDLLAGLALLLDDDISIVRRDDRLDVGSFVPRLDDEPETMPRNPVVLVRRQFNGCAARSVCALAVERHAALDTESLSSSFDEVVHVAEHLLVLGRALGDVCHGSDSCRLEAS